MPHATSRRGYTCNMFTHPSDCPLVSIFFHLFIYFFIATPLKPVKQFREIFCNNKGHTVQGVSDSIIIIFLGLMPLLNLKFGQNWICYWNMVIATPLKPLHKTSWNLVVMHVKNIPCRFVISDADSYFWIAPFEFRNLVKN